MAVRLSEGSINRILQGDQVDKPVLQVLGYKKIPGNGTTDRYRFLVSDGLTCHPFAMLATQLNDRIIRGELEKFTIIRLDRYLCNQVQPGKRILIILDLTQIASGADVGEKIGNPAQPLASSNATNHSEQPHQAPSSNLSSATSPAAGNFGARGPNMFSGNRPSSSFGFMPSNTTSNMQQSVETANIHPIISLTPYQNRWTIKARVTSKSAIRTWSNSRGEGKLFSLTLVDDTGEVRATAFNEQCDKFYNMVELNKVYYISRAAMKSANKAFSSVKNDYEMTFNSETTMTPCNEDTSGIPMMQFDFVGINQLEQVEKDSVIDVIGICKSASDLQLIMSRTQNRELKKKDVQLVDKSNVCITLTLWGEEAEKFDGTNCPVVAIKGARVSDFGGRSLSMINSSTLQINPDMREAHVLRGWYDREGVNSETTSLSNKAGTMGASSNWKTFAQAKGEMLGMGDKADYYTTKATVVMIRRENCMYMACPSEECNKKVVDLNNGLYRCEKCNREYPNYKWRLLLSANLADFSGNQWVTCFQEAAETILGMSAQDLGQMKGMDEDKFNEVITDANFKSYIFRLRTKMEEFNDEKRLKTTAVTVTPLNFHDYAQKLLQDIRQMEAVLPKDIKMEFNMPKDIKMEFN